MLVLISVAIGFGILLGRAMTAFVLIPMSGLAVLVAVVVSRLTHRNEGLTIIASVAGLQFGYILGLALNTLAVVYRHYSVYRSLSRERSDIVRWRRDPASNGSKTVEK